jgi:predicted DNA-binding protein YlxM (UPF0122 family)
MLEDIITSKTRIKLLTRFFLNPSATAYLRELAAEFGVSTNGVREELKQMVDSKLISYQKAGRHILYRANEHHPLFPELHSMVQKSLGMTQVIESVLTRLGDLEEAYLIDDYAAGRDTGIIDLLLVGNINEHHLHDLSRKTERYIGRKIRSLVLAREEFEGMGDNLKQRPRLLLWRREESSDGKE